MLGHVGVKYPEKMFILPWTVSFHWYSLVGVLFNIHLEFMLKESSLSSRCNAEDMDTYERNNIYIAELGCRMGQAWGA